MKRFTALFIIVIALVCSCEPFGFNFMGYKILSEDLDTAWDKVSSYPYELFSGWESPKQFEALPGGECLGFSADLVYYLGESASVVICKTSFCPPGISHAIVYYHGQYIEPQVYGMTYTLGDGTLLSIIETISYNNAMAYSTNYGTKSIDKPGYIFDTVDMKGLSWKR